MPTLLKIQHEGQSQKIKLSLSCKKSADQDTNGSVQQTQRKSVNGGGVDSKVSAVDIAHRAQPRVNGSSRGVRGRKLAEKLKGKSFECSAFDRKRMVVRLKLTKNLDGADNEQKQAPQLEAAGRSGKLVLTLKQKRGERQETLHNGNKPTRSTQNDAHKHQGLVVRLKLRTGEKQGENENEENENEENEDENENNENVKIMKTQTPNTLDTMARVKLTREKQTHIAETKPDQDKENKNNKNEDDDNQTTRQKQHQDEKDNPSRNVVRVKLNRGKKLRRAQVRGQRERGRAKEKPETEQ